ncbi:hypothetical protein QUF72_04710 [Desulfobacterales bacterium HSG2]|nr:hypothetical protein [Desulfobacterales bacterium HSG2]
MRKKRSMLITTGVFPLQTEIKAGGAESAAERHRKRAAIANCKQTCETEHAGHRRAIMGCKRRCTARGRH